MQRRDFIKGSLLLTGGGMVLLNPLSSFGAGGEVPNSIDLINLFRDPESRYRPFVRWWWNGDKIEAGELIRELKLLKEAGIGGVEINPISFPSTGDDLGKKSLTWLSDEWIELLQLTFAEARKLDMTCDLIVGSGWPYGAETLPYDERAQVAIISAEKLTGPRMYETSRFNIFKTVDPGVTTPYPGRSFEILSVKLVPDPMNGLDQVTDLTHKAGEEVMQFDIPEGPHVLYTLVKVNSFASVINGAPGAAGPILNHMDKTAVRKYLDHMSDTLQKKTGPLSNHLRALFTDSMELEGCNWTEDLAEEFKKRRHYDIMPWLPFIMFKVGRLGAVIDENYGAVKSAEFNEEIKRVRFDFELTKAELLYERFTQTYLEWCRDLKVKSRAQAYGRGFFPLESSLGFDIPEGESWTTNWLKHRVGEEMPDEDYRRGRGYTMINKFVSSAAHLTGKRIVSCEEMTNTYQVFNITLEQLKIGSDQSLMSGITHSIWHGFNYSPPDAPFPGWVQYGSYHNENNNWWPYFKYLNDYKARISSLFQNADMFADMAILPATYDLWGEMGVQTDPFPEKLNVPYTSIVWESINKNGGSSDYVTEIILRDATIRKGKICYGSREYGTLFLPDVTSIFPTSLSKLLDFVRTGGRIFCIGKYPEKSPGFDQYQEKDKEVQSLVEQLKAFPDRFILLKKPEDYSFLEWYRMVMTKYQLPRYMEIENPDPWLMQVRYQMDDGCEIFFFANTHMHKGHQTRVTFDHAITRGRFGWVFDPENGEYHRISLNNHSFDMDLGPAESMIVLFNKEKNGPVWEPLPETGPLKRTLQSGWEVELKHSREGWVKKIEMDKLQDLKETEYVSFTGTVTYRIKTTAGEIIPQYLNLGKVWGVAEVWVNGKSCGVKWYGNRIYKIGELLHEGSNDIEIRVITTMGNYMKTLTDNPTAQKYTVRGTKDQPIQSMGLIGPVTLYRGKA